MALPGNADVVVVRGFWWDEATQQGMRQASGQPATVTFTPVPLDGQPVTDTPNLRDLAVSGFLKTRSRIAVVDRNTGYFATQLIASNDPDLDAYAGRLVTFLGEPSFTVEVPYNAPTVTVDAQMAAAVGLPPGSNVKAIWLSDAALVATPPPPAPINYLSSSETLSNIASGIEDHDSNITAHSDIRAALAAETARAAPIASPTFTGTVTLPGDPAGPLQAVPRRYVDQLAYSVKAFGALGDGTTDDTAAINAAIAAALAAPGGRVWFPPGTYATTSVIDVPENVTLEGVHGDTIPYATSPPSPCRIKPLGTHTGTAILRLRGKTETGRTYDHVGARIRNLTLDGTNTPAGTKGIQVAALVREARFEYVTVNATKDTAFWFGAGATATTTMPQSLRLVGCLAKAAGNNGYTFTNVPDSTIIDCNSLGATNVGFYMAGFMNGQMANCRAEWSGQQGVYLTSGYWGTGQGSGGMNMLGCSTDRNGFSGVYVDATGAAPIQLANCVMRRDGRNNNTGGGNYAGLLVATSTTMPVIVDNIHVYPGVDDDGAGTLSPQYGVSSTGSNVVVIDSGYVHAATTAINTGAGLLVDNAVGTATGAPSSPTRVAPLADVPTTRTVTAGTGLTGGGDLSANRSFAVAYGTTSTTAAVGNDARLSDARTPLAHTHTVTDLATTSGTASSSTFLRGDNSWAKPRGTTATNGDAAATLTPGTSASTQVWNTALTAARAVTLAAGTDGDYFRVVRTAAATGAFNLNVGTGPLKALTTASTWVDVTCVGTTWMVTASGSL